MSRKPEFLAAVSRRVSEQSSLSLQFLGLPAVCYLLTPCGA